jgi:molecular chaperone DnaK
MPQVEVTLDVDANGILSVKAKEKTTGKEQSIRIEGSSGLSQADIERMRTEADKHADEDQKKRDLAEAKNGAEQLIYASEKALRDNKDKVSSDIAKAVEEKVAALKKERDSSDTGTIKKATEELSSTLSKIGEAMNKQAPPAAGAPGTDTGKDNGKKPDEGPVRDADFKEEK